MNFWNSLSASFVSALRRPRLWLLQFFGNVIIVLVFAAWLNFPDAHWWQLVFTLIVALLLVVSFAVLHGGTLNYLSDSCEAPYGKLTSAFGKALRNAGAFTVWAILLGLLLWLVGHLDAYQYSFPGYLRSEFPAWLRRLISENGIDNFYLGFVNFLYWVVVPGLLLPFGLFCAKEGFGGFIMPREWGRIVRNWVYWIVLILAVLIGRYCAGKIMSWLLDPRTATLGSERVWLGFRMLFAYLLALFSWLWICAMVGRAHSGPEPPAESQKAAA
ncbi:MAG TPA: hypothetical protein VJA94_10065 [Candidatus Angelobacter sp.]